MTDQLDPRGKEARDARSPAIDLRKAYAVHAARTGNVVALQGLSLQVRPGEFVAVLGPSGAGKSTLLRCLSGRKRLLAGEFHSFGCRLHDLDETNLARWRGKHVAVIRQDYVRALSPDLRVLDQVCLPALLRGMTSGTARSRGLDLLERTGILQLAASRRGQLSGGEQQRVALCAALVPSPSLLLADEVTGELDEDAGQDVLRILRALASEEGATVLLASHDPRATDVADRAVTIRDGRITAELAADGTLMAPIDDGGVLRLEPDQLEAARLGSRVRVETQHRTVTLHPADPRDDHLSSPASAPTRRTDVQIASRGESGGCSTGPRVVLRAVRKSYGRGRSRIDALRHLDVQIEGAGLHAVVGPSGSGKTTLLHLVAGLERPTTGDVVVDDRPLGDLSRSELAALRRERLTVVPQSSSLVKHLSVHENVALALWVRGRRDEEAVREAIIAVGIGELLDRRASQLSGGELQRLAVARALVPQPRVLLADEPTSNLDQRNAVRLARLLAEVACCRGMLVLCATHDNSVVAVADSTVDL